MTEKEILDKIRQDSEQVTPPAALQPDAIEKLLASQKTNSAAPGQEAHQAVEEPTHIQKNPPKKQRGKIYRMAARYGSLAAVFALALAAAWHANEATIRSKQEDSAAEAAAQTSADADESPATRATDIPAQTSADAGESPATRATEAPMREILTYADSYEEVFEALHGYYYAGTATGYAADGTYYAEEIAEDADTGAGISGSALSESRSAQTSDMAANADLSYADTAAAAEDGADGFSDTNVQEEGVDEADIVKTDGSYIYILRSDCSVVILEADGADSHVVSTTQIGEDTGTSCEHYIQEMYLDGDILNVIVREYITSLQSEGDVYRNDTTEQTTVYTYDIADRSSPELAGTLSQDGSYTDSRKVGSYLYLFTTYYPDVQDTYEDSVIVPRVGGEPAAASDFYLPEQLSGSSYLVISSADTSAPGQICDSKILVSGASLFYVSTENIYVADTNYSSDARTEITKFHFADGQITGTAAGTVRGYLNDSFSMNEYDGMLRVVTTYYGDATKPLRDSVSSLTGIDLSVSDDWEERNALYILDGSLQQTGIISDLAKGETVRSARFLGDTGYFVTFRQTDPLFSVDLSDPENPQVLGELKISGFSSYLHFYGDGLLLGIGYEADESTGITSGLKLSMFDLSDPSDVSEGSRYVIPGITWCPAIEDYKAILVEPGKNIIGFYCDNRYLLFSYDQEDGFTQELVYDFYTDQLTGQASYNTMRGLFIGDTLYLAGETFLVTFDMEDGFRKTGVLDLTAAGSF